MDLTINNSTWCGIPRGVAGHVYLPLGVVAMTTLIPLPFLIQKEYHHDSRVRSISFSWREPAAQICVGICSVFTWAFYAPCIEDAAHRALLILLPFLLIVIACVNGPSKKVVEFEIWKAHTYTRVPHDEAALPLPSMTQSAARSSKAETKDTDPEAYKKMENELLDGTYYTKMMNAHRIVAGATFLMLWVYMWVAFAGYFFNTESAAAAALFYVHLLLAVICTTAYAMLLLLWKCSGKWGAQVSEAEHAFAWTLILFFTLLPTT